MERRWLLWVTLSLFAGTVAADLPSCERARCIHCSIEFIARMCPSTCGACPAIFKNGKAKTEFMTRKGVVSGGEAPRQPPPVTAPPPRAPVQVPPAALPQEKQSSAGSSGSAQLPPTVPRQQFGAPQVQQPPIPHLPPQPPPAFAPPPAPKAPDAGLLRQQPVLPNQLPQFQQLATNQQQYSIPQQPFQPFQQSQFVAPPQYQQSTFAVAPSPPQPQPVQQQYQIPQQQSFYQSQTPAPFNQQFYPWAPFPGQQQQQQPQSPFFNPFQPFLGQTYQAATVAPQAAVPPQSPAVTPAPFNPFTLPTPPPSYLTPAPFFQQLQPQLPQESRPSAYNVPPPPSPPPNLAPPVPTAPPQQPIYKTAQPQHAPVPAVVPTASPSTTLPPPPASPLPPPAIAASIDGSPNTAFAKGYSTGNVQPQCPQQPGWQPCISKEVANERFRNCCARLGEGCVQLCSYDSTLTTIQLAVLTGRCPLGKVGEMMICASGYEDATPCCEAYNVFERGPFTEFLTSGCLGYEHCRPYCNPAAGLPDATMLAEKYKCLVKLSQIQQCFYLTQRP